jgi:hypothetical protein
MGDWGRVIACLELCGASIHAGQPPRADLDLGLHPPFRMPIRFREAVVANCGRRTSMTASTSSRAASNVWRTNFAKRTGYKRSSSAFSVRTTMGLAGCRRTRSRSRSRPPAGQDQPDRGRAARPSNPACVPPLMGRFVGSSARSRGAVLSPTSVPFGLLPPWRAGRALCCRGRRHRLVLVAVLKPPPGHLLEPRTAPGQGNQG